MTKQLWINLPVKDVAKSKAFFSKLGFPFNEQMSGPQSACMMVGENKLVVMLFAEELFRGFVRQELTDTRQSSEVLFSIDAESRSEVDEMIQKAKDAGGDVFAPAGENQGWMYGAAFADLDDHRWNILYMDFAKMPRG